MEAHFGGRELGPYVVVYLPEALHPEVRVKAAYQPPGAPSEPALFGSREGYPVELKAASKSPMGIKRMPPTKPISQPARNPQAPKATILCS